MSARYPVKVALHQRSKTLEIHFDDGQRFTLSAEFLRVMSPSAEVKGHGPGQEVLQVGKRHVGIDNVEAVGNYAIKLSFDDGHDSGLYTWDYLYDLGRNHDTYWRDYLDKLVAAGQSREGEVSVVRLLDPGES